MRLVHVYVGQWGKRSGKRLTKVGCHVRDVNLGDVVFLRNYGLPVLQQEGNFKIAKDSSVSRAYESVFLHVSIYS